MNNLNKEQFAKLVNDKAEEKLNIAFRLDDKDKEILRLKESVKSWKKLAGECLDELGISNALLKEIINEPNKV